MPKYAIGNQLELSGAPSDYFVVVGFQSPGGVQQYVMQQYTNGQLAGNPFALDVSDVDSNPIWHLKGTSVAWIAAGVGGALVLLILTILLIRRKRR